MDQQEHKGIQLSYVIYLKKEPGSVIEEVLKDKTVRRYLKGKFLGKGGFAKCYEITNADTRKLLAAKVIPKSTLTKNRAKQKLMSEIKIHRSLQQKNVVGFEHFFEDEENVYILLELCPNQTMNELIRRRKRLTEIEVQCYLVQILGALKYLHKYNVIHRDLKLGNLFLSSKMEVKLGDFGLATKVEFEGERKRTICGTPNYIAPEILDGKTGHSYEVDVWSLGVICYTMLVGKPPFETNDVKSTYRRIRMNAYQFPEHLIISQQAKNLVQKLLVSEPNKRLTLNEIEQHEFLNSSGSIPKLLPVSTLACPPSATFLRQFQQKENESNPSSPSVRKNGIENTDQRIKQIKKPFSQTGEKERNTLMFSVQQLPQQVRQQITPVIDTVEVNPVKHIPYLSYGNMDNIKPKQPLFKSVDRFQTTQQIQPAPIDNPLNQNYIEPEQNLKGPTIWINKWVDYSSKYGLGYLLQNRQCGVFFNDCTKILMSSDNDSFIYIDRNGIETPQQISSYNPEYQKKVTLLNHFKNYLFDQKNNTNFPLGQIKGDLITTVYVKKWVKSKHAIMFRFSDKTVQVIFTDGTQVILTSALRVVTYLNKNQEKTTMLLSQALESDCSEMIKRLKYTKESLSQMLQTNNDQQNVPTPKQNNYINNGSQERIVSSKPQIVQPLTDGMNKLNTITDNIGSIKSNKPINQTTQPLSKQSNTVYQSMNSLGNYNKISSVEKNYQTLKSSSLQKFQRINSLQGK